MGDLPLVFVERRRVEIADAAGDEREPRRLALAVGDLELAVRGADDRGDPRRRIDDPREVGKTAPLVGKVVDRMIAALRVLDADGVAQCLAGDEIIELPDPAAIFKARLHPAVLSAIDR